jgi:hypothetical protein
MSLSVPEAPRNSVFWHPKDLFRCIPSTFSCATEHFRSRGIFKLGYGGKYHGGRMCSEFRLWNPAVSHEQLCLLPPSRILGFPLLSHAISGTWQQIQYSDSLRAGLSGNRIWLGARFSRIRSDRPWDPLSLLYSEYLVLSLGVKWPRCGFDHQPHLAPRLKKEYNYTYCHSGSLCLL